MVGIDDQIPEVGIIAHRLEEAPPDILAAPATEAAEDLFHSPNGSGRSRQGAPVRTIHKTPSTNMRSSRPVEPFWSGRPMIDGATRFQATSLKINRSIVPEAAS